MATDWKRRSVRIPIAIATGLVLLVRALVVIGWFAPRPTGPMPEGTRLTDGVLLGYDASEGGRALVAEVRGRRTHPGAVRDVLYVAREPFEDEDFEALGRGATLGQISDDGRFVSWLANKERSDRTGPGRLRAVEKDAPPLEHRSLLPPVLFDRATPRAIGLASYRPAAGRGTLTDFDFAAGRERVLAPHVPPGMFSFVSGGRVFAIRRPNSVSNGEAVILTPGAGPAPPLTRDVDMTLDRLPFRVARDGRSVTIRLAPDTSGRRALVRWRDGEPALSRLADDVAAWTLDRDGRAWWVVATGETVRAMREPDGAGAPIVLGEFPGRDPVSVHPLPSGDGAWIALADRRCGADSRSGCLRLALAGSGAAPPVVDGLRRVLSPREGWPVVLYGPVGGEPALVAAANPEAPVEIREGGALTVAFSPDGEHVGAHVSADDGERVLLVDLVSGTTRLLSERGDRGGSGTPRVMLSWHGDALLYVWRNRTWRLDPRNGLYRVVPD